MKKIFILTYLFFSCSLIVNAQHEKGKEKIRAIKIAYLTEKLNLTSTEAEKFWPVYNEYHKKRRALFKFEKHEIKKRIKEGYNTDSITNEEAEKILVTIIKNREEHHKDRTNYQEKLQSILPAKKILILEITEREFNKKLMRKLKNKND